MLLRAARYRRASGDYIDVARRHTRDGYRLAPGYVDRLLKGAKTADLPVQQPDRHALAINLATAKALALPVAQSVLLQADEVIR